MKKNPNYPTAPESKASQGAWIRFCGHNGMFYGEIMRVGNCVVVRASTPSVTPSNIKRPAIGCSFHLSDSPGPVYWGENKGIFVVPHENLTVLDPETDKPLKE